MTAPTRTGSATSVPTDAVIALGEMALAFGRVDRITFHPDGTTPESDTDHTVMLGLLACAFAERHFPHLSVGLIAQYALVHDLVEVHAGDTPTLRLPSVDAAADKKRRERAAYDRIYAEYIGTLPWLPTLIDEYELLATPEARYVKALDKVTPKITHLLNGGASIRRQGLDRVELAERYSVQGHDMRGYAGDFPEALELWAELVAMELALVDGPDVPA